MTNEHAPAPAKGGSGMKIVLALGGCLVLAVVGCCLFAIIGSQLDPEFQARQKEKKEKGRTWIAETRTKLANLAAKLPAPGSLTGEKKLPAELRDKVADPILTDAALLSCYKADGTVAAPDSKFLQDEDLAALTDNFKDSPKVEEWPDYSVSASVDMVERLKKKGYVAVFLPTTFTQPALAGDGFMGGVADGQLALFSLEDGALVAHGPLQARSSETIQYKKRGFRFRRIPLGGSDNKAQALADDFAERCQEAVDQTLARLEAP